MTNISQGSSTFQISTDLIRSWSIWNCSEIDNYELGFCDFWSQFVRKWKRPRLQTQCHFLYFDNEFIYHLIIKYDRFIHQAPERGGSFLVLFRVFVFSFIIFRTLAPCHWGSHPSSGPHLSKGLDFCTWLLFFLQCRIGIFGVTFSLILNMCFTYLTWCSSWFPWKQSYWTLT